MKRHWKPARWLRTLLGVSRPLRNKPRPTVRLWPEPLEDRWLPSALTFMVTNTNANGGGSLRQAIPLSNAHATTQASPNIIDFNISTGGAVQVLHVGDNSGGGGTLNQALPAL